MNMLKKIVLLFALVLFPLAAQAEFAVSQHDVKGYGQTRSEAVNDALLEAIRQNRGVDLQADREVVRETPERLALADSLALPEQPTTVVRDQVRESVRGSVRQYRVLDAHELEDGRWEARLLVAFTHYKSPGVDTSKRRRIAVMPFRTAAPSFLFDGEWVPAEELSGALVQQVVTELAQSRRFVVLDRDYMDAYLNEKSLMLSSDSDESEMMKTGRVLGVDYMLVGTVTGGGESRAEKHLDLTGERTRSGAASLAVDYRIIVMATREVKWAASERVVLEDSAMPEADDAASEGVQSTLVRRAAQLIVQKALDNIYPLRIVGRNASGEVLLNQGGVTLCKGELFDVFAAGPGVKDHYTGESLGAVESRIGCLRVVRVAAKKSYAVVVEGELADMADGSICRRSAEGEIPSPESSGRPAGVRLSGDGGVLLPFDR
ncbi:penicillin-binding protein activator LpoB [Chlorobium sp. N1]|nr:penicillin-binding protein activator LpoB [Chlorobium sp. N1]